MVNIVWVLYVWSIWVGFFEWSIWAGVVLMVEMGWANGFDGRYWLGSSSLGTRLRNAQSLEPLSGSVLGRSVKRISELAVQMQMPKWSCGYKVELWKN